MIDKNSACVPVDDASNLGLKTTAMARTAGIDLCASQTLAGGRINASTGAAFLA